MNNNNNVVIRYISGTLAGLVLAGTFIVTRNKDVKIIKDSSIDTVKSFCDTTDTNRIDMDEEMYNKLSKLSTYLELSEELYQIYDKYGNKIDNLTLGEVDLVDGKIQELSNSELEYLRSNIDRINSTFGTSHSEKLELAREVLAYTSSVNGYIFTIGYNDLYDSLLEFLKKDASLLTGINEGDIDVSYRYNDLRISDVSNNMVYDEFDIHLKEFKDIKKFVGDYIDRSSDIDNVIKGNKERYNITRGLNIVDDAMLWKDGRLICYHNDVINDSIRKNLDNLKVLFFRNASYFSRNNEIIYSNKLNEFYVDEVKNISRSH